MTSLNENRPVLKIFQELRFRLLLCFFVFIVCFFAAFYLSDSIWFFLHYPIKDIAQLELINLTPVEAIQVDFKMAGMAALLLAAPFCFYQFYAFCAEALYPTEKNTVLFFAMASFVFFCLGIFFAFYTVLPLLLSFLAHYSSYAKALWSQEAYVSFLIRLEISFGLIFQMPVVAAFLSKIKVIDAFFFARHFRISIFILALLAALITPPDIFSMVFMMVPMLLLYMLTIVANWLFAKDSV